MPVRTNRDLYLLVAGLPPSSRSLADYLGALWRLAASCRGADALPPAQFAELLVAAFHVEPLSYDRARVPSDAAPERAGYARFEHAIATQIVDLHEMAEDGSLADEHRYFGLDSPRGARWYNFEPHGYLECAVAGTFDGWCEGDPTGRAYVPGPVAVLDASGAVTSVDPRCLDGEVEPLPPITWDVFADFLWAGQSYE